MNGKPLREMGPIVLDARFVHEGGPERYISELVAALGSRVSPYSFIAYVPSTDYASRLKLPRPGWEVVILQTRTYHPREQWILCRQVWRDKPALLHAMNYWVVPLVQTVPLVVTVHDVLTYAQPSFLSLKARVYSRAMNRLALRRARRVMTVSEFARREILRYWPGAAAKTVAIPSGVGEQFRPVRDVKVRDDIRTHHGLPPAYLLYVGSAKPHKNIIAMLKAFALLPNALRTRCPLVMVSTVDPRYPEILSTIESHGLTGQVLWRHGAAVNRDLAGFYSLATALLMPSLYECFGFPLLEAMACGTPTLASRAGSLVEVGGDASLYVDPMQPAEIAAGLCRLLEDDELRLELSCRGQARAKDFTWERTAAAVRMVYEEVLAGGPPI